jgi:hypothetical protein
VTVARLTIEDSQVVPGVFVNPGSGHLTGGTEHRARANMVILLGDAGLTGTRFYRRPRADEGGRFAFSVRTPAGLAVVLMPGWPLARVRYTGSPQSPWDFPRLYVDGSSWLWKYAAEILAEVE